MLTSGMPVVKAAGRSLSYEWIEGDGRSRPTLVFLHEGLGSIRQWRDFPVQVVAATGCRALVYDRYGYGESDILEEARRPVRFMHDEALCLPPGAAQNAPHRRCHPRRALRRRLDRAYPCRRRPFGARRGGDGAACVHRAGVPRSHPRGKARVRDDRSSGQARTLPSRRAQDLLWLGRRLDRGYLQEPGTSATSTCPPFAARCSRCRATTTSTARWRSSTTSPGAYAGPCELLKLEDCGHTPVSRPARENARGGHPIRRQAQMNQDAKVIGLVGSAHGLSHFLQLAVPPLFPMIRADLGISYSALGVVIMVFFAASALLQPVAGFLVDRVGGQKVLLGGVGLMALGMLIAGFAYSTPVLALGMFLMGVGNSVFHPADFSILNGTRHAGAPGLRFQRARGRRVARVRVRADLLGRHRGALWMARRAACRGGGGCGGFRGARPQRRHAARAPACAQETQRGARCARARRAAGAAVFPFLPDLGRRVRRDLQFRHLGDAAPVRHRHGARLFGHHDLHAGKRGRHDGRRLCGDALYAP